MNGGEEDCQNTSETQIIEDERIDITNTEVEIFGDAIAGNNTRDTLRIGFININGIPSSAHHPKNKELLNSINSSKLSIIGLAETNRCWHRMRIQDKWQERTRGWWETQRTALSYNLKDNDIATEFQPGGTALISINKAAHRILETGNDSTKLGRWSWTLYRGRHDMTLRVICAYRPCKPHQAGPNTAYSQQLRYMDLNRDNRCPRQAMLEDLGTFIEQCKAEGDQIILMMDCNENVKSRSFGQWLQNIGLQNAILNLHQTNDDIPTFHKGSQSIDGIFVSSTIHSCKGGYMPFGLFPSDHRGLWIEVTYANAFGYNVPRTIVPSARRLKSDDPRIRNKWNSSYESFIRANKLHIRQFNMEKNLASMNEETIYTESEKIRKLRMEGIKYADKRCRKLHMGGVPFSDEYDRLTSEMELWKAVLKKKMHCKYSMSKLRRLMRKTNISHPFNNSIQIIKNKLKDVTNEYWKFKKTAKDTRVTFLESKASAVAKESGQEKKVILKQLITRERQRESARRIKYTLGKLRGGGISRVEVATNDGIREVTTKTGIERECMEENIKKFRQTQATPCMREPLRSALGFLGNTEAGENILRGVYEPPQGTSIYTQEFLQQLQKPPQIFATPLHASMTTKEFQSGWKRMKEKTSSGISGLHFGHMKACAHNSFLASFEASLAQIPFITGHSPSSWQYGVNVMIQKKAKVDLVTKLRTITLTEADFNFNNKYLGKQTIDHAERYNLLAKEQYGSRKGKNSIEQAVHKRLTFDIIRQTRMNGALCSNDAKSCYDRIIHSVACLAYRRLGVPYPPVECMFKTIQKMKHHIRTTFGDSAFTMSSEGSFIPFQGVLQGNGASPATWVILSTPLLNMLRAAGNGGYFTQPISQEITHSVGYSFVDDTDLLQYDSRDENATIENTMEKMQSAIDRWEGGLKATGGAIVPDKSFVYPIAFDFDEQGKWTYKKTDDIDYEFTVCDHDDNRHALRQLEASDGQCTLGVHLAPDGNNEASIQYLKQKATDWKELITTGHLQRDDAWQALETTIIKTLQYPLPALTLSEKECNQIIRPVLDAGLNKASICKKFPKAVIHGPKDEGGLNLPNLYTYQGLSRIELLQDHLGNGGMTDELLRTSIELAKVEVGVGRNLFQLDFTKYEHILTDCWVKETWRFAHENNIEIKDSTTKNLNLHRENDVFLMEIFAHHGYKKAILQKINRCRLYLQVTTLSDIVCGYGTKFTKALNCIYDKTIPHHHKWPNQTRPGAASIRAWRKALKECFPRERGTLEYQLGQWLYPPPTSWIWFYSPRTHLIYQKQGRLWRIWRRSSRGGTLGVTPRYRYDTNGLSKPNDCIRATIIRQNVNYLQLTGWKGHANGEPYTLQNTNDTQWMLQDTHHNDNFAEIGTHINNGSIKAVSDGSFLPHQKMGTAAWIIEAPDSTIQYTGRIICPGPAKIQCAHRSELIGILGMILHIDKICKEHNIREGEIEIGCDGLGALTAIESKAPLIRSSWKHFDLITSIRRLMRQSPINWKTRHILGHQDDDNDFHDLDRWSQLNILVDSMAKHKLTSNVDHITTIRQQPFYLPHEKCSIYWHDRRTRGIKICSELKSTLTSLIHTNSIRQHWIQKRKFSGYTESFVDWEATQRSRRNISKSRQRWMCKWMAGFCGVGIMLVRYSYQKHSKCPRCLQSNETTSHVIQCPHPEAVTLWKNEVEKLCQWMKENQGHPELITIIQRSLLEWRATSRGYQDTPSDPTLAIAVRRQKNIGWKSFIEGFWANEWRQCQHDHFQSIRSRRSSLLWITKVQRKIWEIAWSMWQHRNAALHNEGNTIHKYEMMALDTEIREEMTLGLDGLDRKYSHLFEGSLQSKLEFTMPRKRMWIMSVWAARDNMEAEYEGRQRNRDVQHIYHRWVKKCTKND